MYAVKNIFAPKSSRVLRVLLTNYGREGPLEEGAEETFKQLGAELAKMM